MTIDLKGPAGRLEALLDEPDHRPVRAAAVFGHPHPMHGGTMHTKIVYHSAKALQKIGCATLRFHYRGVGQSEGTLIVGLEPMEDYRAALDFMAERYPGVELWAAGFSFGAYIAFTVGPADNRVSTLLGLGLPANRYEFPDLLATEKPKFLIHAERDEVCSVRTIRWFYGQLREPKELVVIDGADHLFDGKVSEAAETIEDLLGP